MTISMKSLLLLLPLFFLAAESVNFTCSAPSTATCQSLAGYVAVNSTTLSYIQSLFQLPSLLPLLSANDLPLSTPATHPIQSGSTVRVPFPCRCSKGIGQSDHVPVYTVGSHDQGQGLDYIARTLFDQFVTYPEIVAANGIADPSLIFPQQKLWIPLPCSCDGEGVVHLGHVTAKGSSVEEIAAEFGTTQQELLRLNRMGDPKSLQADQVLDVPLRACSSSIKDTSLDKNLLVANGSYALTAENCIQCSCSSSNYILSCKPVQGLNNKTCPAVPKCGERLLGESTIKGCELTTCSYEGYTDSNVLKIMAGSTTQSNCAPSPAPSAGGNSPAPSAGGNSPAPSAGGNSPVPSAGGNSPPGGGGSAGSRLRLRGYDGVVLLLLPLQFVLFWFGF